MGNRPNLIDLHAHVLAGLDDGPRSLPRSVRLCELLADEGVGTVAATPHVYAGPYETMAARIRRGVVELSEACRQAGVAVSIVPGSEMRVQPELVEALDAGSLVTLGDTGRYLLLEFHPHSVPPMERLLFELELRGVRVVLSHPERHWQFQRDTGLLAALVERGCLVQVTAVSLLDGYGPGVRRAAEIWLRRGLVHVVASDAHSAMRRPPWMQRAAERLTTLGGEGLMRRLMVTHPMRILRGEPLEDPAADAPRAAALEPAAMPHWPRLAPKGSRT